MDQAMAGPKRWTVGEYTLEWWGPESAPKRWGLSAHGKGVQGCRTPFGAFLALRRWRRVPNQPI